MSARHFLHLSGARTLPTDALGRVERAVSDLIEASAMGAIHGPAGLGKTFAVEQALSRREDVAACWVSFPSRPTMRLVAATLLAELTGTTPTRSRDRFAMTADLLEELRPERSGRARAVVIDESQQLNRECIEYLRYLHDHLLTVFTMVLVGGDGTWQVLSREPMLRSRIYRRVPFQALTLAQVTALIPRFHPIYDGVAAELVVFIDDHFAHGNLRDWAAFTRSAAALCTSARRARVDERIARNVFALHSGEDTGTG